MRWKKHKLEDLRTNTVDRSEMVGGLDLGIQKASFEFERPLEVQKEILGMAIRISIRFEWSEARLVQKIIPNLSKM